MNEKLARHMAARVMRDLMGLDCDADEALRFADLLRGMIEEHRNAFDKHHAARLAVAAVEASVTP